MCVCACAHVSECVCACAWVCASIRERVLASVFVYLCDEEGSHKVWKFLFLCNELFHVAAGNKTKERKGVSAKWAINKLQPSTNETRFVKNGVHGNTRFEVRKKQQSLIKKR